MRRLLVLVGSFCVLSGAQTLPGWTKGKGFGWVYGKNDELGAIQAITSPQSVLRALQDVKKGRLYDLGVRVDRTSFKWPGHSPTEIISFRSPGGLTAGRDIAGFAQGERNVAFHSCALFMSDNLGTQIDGLGHITSGKDNHWY
ncbi:MAG TPA: hypothetical protein VES20_18115, partial [Bryobacteraceae bacterium]|nr:hypothetical protein [Bryobacteraceae bacterium]